MFGDLEEEGQRGGKRDEEGGGAFQFGSFSELHLLQSHLLPFLPCSQCETREVS